MARLAFVTGCSESSYRPVVLDELRRLSTQLVAPRVIDGKDTNSSKIIAEVNRDNLAIARSDRWLLGLENTRRRTIAGYLESQL